MVTKIFTIVVLGWCGFQFNITIPGNFVEASIPEPYKKKGDLENKHIMLKSHNFGSMTLYKFIEILAFKPPKIKVSFEKYENCREFIFKLISRCERHIFISENINFISKTLKSKICFYYA